MSKRLFPQLKLLTAAGFATAILYTIGVAYSLGFYGRVGLDNLDLLGFGVQNHVLNSYSAVNVLLAHVGLGILTVVAAGLLVATLIGYRRRLPGRVELLSLVIGALALIAVAAIWRPVGSGLIVFCALAILGSIAVADVLERSDNEIADRGRRTYDQAARELVPHVLLVLCVLGGWRALVGSAAQAGEVQACVVALGRDDITPLVEVVTRGRVVENSGATRVEPLEGDLEHFRLFNVRLFNTAPAGVILYADDRPPNDLLFVPSEQIVSITVTPDGGNVGGTSPAWC